MKYETLTTKEIAYISTFGALWGASEVTFGFIMHNLRFPFSGLILTLIGTIISLVCVKITNKKRAIIYVALIAATIKLLSITTIKLGPVIGIVASAFMAQIVVFAFGINLISYILAGGVMAVAPFVQFLTGQLSFYSAKIFTIYQDSLIGLGLNNLKVLDIFFIILILHFTLGCIAGFISWNLSKSILKRLNND